MKALFSALLLCLACVGANAEVVLTAQNPHGVFSLTDDETDPTCVAIQERANWPFFRASLLDRATGETEYGCWTFNPPMDAIFIKWDSEPSLIRYPVEVFEEPNNI